jgi:hypothetical protein
MISEYTRSESKLLSLINQSQQTLQQLETEKETLMASKTTLELEIEDLMR